MVNQKDTKRARGVAKTAKFGRNDTKGPLCVAGMRVWPVPILVNLFQDGTKHRGDKSLAISDFLVLPSGFCPKVD